MTETFIFPETLHNMTLQRLCIDMTSVDAFKARLDSDSFKGRITDITLKVKETEWDMRFCLDGRKSGKCVIEPTWQGWVDAGLLSLYELAIHFSTSIKPGFARQPVQQKLFT